MNRLKTNIWETTVQLYKSSICSHLEGCVQFLLLHPTDVTEKVKTQGRLRRQEWFRGLEKLSCCVVWKRPAAHMYMFCSARSIQRSIGCGALPPEWAPVLRYVWMWAHAKNVLGSSPGKRCHWSFPAQADPAGIPPKRKGHNESTSNNKWYRKGAWRINKAVFN